MRSAMTAVAATVFLMMASGCANTSAPKTQAAKTSLVAEADAALTTMTAKDSSLRDLVDRSPGYAVFPDVGKAGAIIGGAYGRGVVYEHGRPTGYTEMKQASIGAQLGAQDYSELIVFENDASLARLKSGDFDVGAEATAVALKSGAARSATFQGGAVVFTLPRGGLMASAAIRGQKLNFEPMSGSDPSSTGTDATTASDRSSSVRSVNRDLGPNQEMRIRTERSGSNGSSDTTTTTSTSPRSSSDNGQTATERTQQRIEQRRDAATGSNPQ